MRQPPETLESLFSQLPEILPDLVGVFVWPWWTRVWTLLELMIPMELDFHYGERDFKE